MNSDGHHALEGRGEAIATSCGICGARLLGAVWDTDARLEAGKNPEQHSFASESVTGLVCKNCGRAICWGKHKKELKPYGFRMIKWGNCPWCATPMAPPNGSLIYHNSGELISDVDACMFCGARGELCEVPIWTGAAIECKGDPDDMVITLGLAFFTGGLSLGLSDDKRTYKAEQIESSTYRVCQTCSDKKMPERHATEARLSRDPTLDYGAQREPFES